MTGKILNLLGQHNVNEEAMLYSMVDRLTRSEEAVAIFHDMENILTERLQYLL